LFYGYLTKNDVSAIIFFIKWGGFVAIVDGQNPDKVKYFDLRDYISKIKVDSSVLSHMQDTSIEFRNYMEKISKFDKDQVINYWLIQMAEELVSSNKIEKHIIKKQDILKQNLFFETLDISHKRIHEVHKFVMQKEVASQYRTGPIRVSAIMPDGTEKIYWHGPEAEDVLKFMDAFIDIYQTEDTSILNLNPFLKSALIQLLFIRIHPYSDGNGRVSRMLHSIKTTEAINKIYDKNYTLCPLNISGSILINQIRYVQILDNIYFDLEHDNTEYINKWFDFILNMIDEQLYYATSQISKLKQTYDIYKTDDKKFNIMLKRILDDIKMIDDVESINNFDEEVVQRILK